MTKESLIGLNEAIRRHVHTLYEDDADKLAYAIWAEIDTFIAQRQAALGDASTRKDEGIQGTSASEGISSPANHCEDNLHMVSSEISYNKDDILELMVKAMEPDTYSHVHAPESDGYWKARARLQKARKRAAKCYDAIRPYLATRVPVSGLQPIETMKPIDGSVILWNDDRKIGLILESKRAFSIIDGKMPQHLRFLGTHWMPVPEVQNVD